MSESQRTDRGAIRRQRVESLMRADFIAVDPAENLLGAARLMRLARLRHVLVVRGGMLVGILSHRDVLEHLLDGVASRGPESRAQAPQETAVEQLMHSPPDAVSKDAPLVDAAEQMLHFKIGCLPVVEPTRKGARLLGLITEADLLRAAYADSG